MRNLILLLSSITLAFAANSCNKENKTVQPLATTPVTVTNKEPLIAFLDSTYQLTNTFLEITGSSFVETSRDYPFYYFGFYKHNNNTISIHPVDLTVPNTGVKTFGFTSDTGTIPYMNSYGSYVNLQFDSTIFRVSFIYKAYMPDKISLISPAYAEDQHVSPGTLIVWNSNNNNRFSDYITVTYKAGWRQNDSIAANGFKDDISKVFIMNQKQNAYSFTAEDLKEFPANGYVSIQLCRYNYDFFRQPKTNEYYTIITGNATKGTFKLLK